MQPAPRIPNPPTASTGRRPRRAELAQSGLMLAAFAALAALAGLAAPAAHADGDRVSRQLMASPQWQTYRQECASCHTAYPPGLLQAASWRRIMGGLQKHYGTDASLDAATVGELAGWLERNAGSGKRTEAAPPEDRITRSAWFVRKHREIAPRDWLHPSVRSAANCAACHTRADAGDYDDDSVRMPAGVGLSGRRSGHD